MAYTYKRRIYLVGMFAVGALGLVLYYNQSLFGSLFDGTEYHDHFTYSFCRMATEKVEVSPECRRSPSFSVEQSKRHIVQTVRDQWLFMKSQIRLLQRLSNDSFDSNSREKFRNILQYMSAHGSEYARVLELEMNKLNHLDGWDVWRNKESKKLRETVRQRIYNLQNPENCSEAPVLLCDLTNDSGFGSGMHDVLWCFVKAYQQKRRLVLRSSHWHYAPGEWEKIFQPLSDTCSNSAISEKPLTFENNNKVRGILRALPQDLGSQIILLHGNPLGWWYGQFISYLMRPNKQLQSSIDRMKKKLDFTAPIVGIHVRRTDKVGTEAKSYPLEEYMEHVENYFQSLELKSTQSVKRRVFIATDDPNVVKECSMKYPEYECLYNLGSAESATKIETRYSNSSLHNLVMDVYALASTDYIVCTFSSGLGRLTFELMSAINEKSVDASDKALSLDVVHYYGYVMPPAREAIYNHIPKSSKEIPFSSGDILFYKDIYRPLNAGRTGKVSDGFLEMINKKQRTLQGLIPTYKTKETFLMSEY